MLYVPNTLGEYPYLLVWDPCWIDDVGVLVYYFVYFSSARRSIAHREYGVVVFHVDYPIFKQSILSWKQI